MQGSKRAQDPFELYKLQSEANLRRMKKERRLNPKSTDATISETPINSIWTARKPLQQISANARNRTVVAGAKNTPTTQKAAANVKTVLRNMHSQGQISNTQVPMSIPISKVITLAEKSGFSTTQRNGVNNRFVELIKFISHSLPEKGNQANMENRKYMKDFADWFRINRHSYIIANANLEKLRKQLPGHESEHSNNYPLEHKIREIFSDHALRPTHVVTQIKQYGKFLYCLKLRCITSDTVTTALLPRTDLRFEINVNDFLILPQDPDSIQHVLEDDLPVYKRWKIYHEKALDVNFFS